VIPLLAIPVVNRPDLLAACVASIDHPVERLLIIDNSREGGITEGVTFPDCIEDVWITEPPGNLGYTASVNFAIKSTPKAPYWMVANADTAFAPGDLARLADVADDFAAIRRPLWAGIVDWRVFALTAEAVEAAGLWDENFYNYCSDADYEYRCTLADVPILSLPGETSHVGSVCYQGDPRNAAHNARSYPSERAYYRAKWGGELRGGERFATPFDKGGSVADWTLDLPRLRLQVWD
jgi:GT2 family glycosyltransferase